MMRLTLLFLLALFSINLFGQDEGFEGHWTGVITQLSGYRSEYKFKLQLRKEGDSFVGWSSVSVDSIYAEIEMRGVSFNDQLLILEDVKILDNHIISGLEWCIKSYQLMLKKEGDVYRLEGEWQGKTSFGLCPPGKAVLKRGTPRA